MNKRGAVAVLAGTFLVGSEMAHGWEFELRRNLGDVPHAHVESFESVQIDVTSPLSASGGQHDQSRYYVRVIPASANGDPSASGYHVFAFPDFGTDAMCGFFDDLETLMTSFESALGLPNVQLENTRRSLQGGIRTEIGGYRARLYLDEETMRGLGLHFGPPES